MTEPLSMENRATCEISFTVNGESKTIRAYPMERLLDVLRRQLGLTGAKEGCGEGECGSCSVLMNGVLVNSCLIPVLQASEARHRHHRRTGQRRSTGYIAECIPAMRRSAVRNLHAGDDPGRFAPAEEKSAILRSMRSAKLFREICAAAPATSRFLRPSQKRPGTGQQHEIESRRVPIGRARQFAGSSIAAGG